MKGMTTESQGGSGFQQKHGSPMAFREKLPMRHFSPSHQIFPDDLLLLYAQIGIQRGIFPDGLPVDFF